MSELTITTSQIEGRASVTVLHLQGHLHGATENQLLEHARHVHETGGRHILLNMSELEVLSSAGLRALQNIFKLYTPHEDVETLKNRDGEPYKSPYLKLVCPNPQIYYILSITGFLQNIPLYNNLEEAAQSFQ
jgi:anti-anti-sigma factor